MLSNVYSKKIRNFSKSYFILQLIIELKNICHLKNIYEPFTKTHNTNSDSRALER